VSDAVFALTDVPHAEKITNESCLARNPANVAISVRQWSCFDSQEAGGMDAHKRSISGLATWPVEKKGSKVTFLSNCQGVPEYRYDDSAVARAIKGEGK